MAEAARVAERAPATPQDLPGFLAGIERRALMLARIGLRDNEEALDAVQDAMLSFVKSYARHPPAEWPPLFHRVLESRIRDRQRRRKVRERLRVWFKSGSEAGEGDATDPLEQVADAREAGPLQSAADRDTRSALSAAVEALPRRQRQAFVLRVWEGCDVRATASAMGCSEGTVKTHLARALDALRGKLESYR